ncbi:unnamed protein product [Staurois parvus]|uniref:Uncharacterized protein n=1 Tax=Staurois parvus TaxID=386267 RepID=A0ABN9EXK1_9NEOB|nr:unnamed protein product [Staurois parvus]
MKLSKMSSAIDSADIWQLLWIVRFSMRYPTLPFYMAYHFMAELLLFPVAFTLL